MKTKNELIKDSAMIIKCPLCGFEFKHVQTIDANKPLRLLACPKCKMPIEIGIKSKEK